MARNVTSAGRLMDVLPVFASDPRVQTVFTTVDGSAFSDGLDGYLSDVQARVVPWSRAVHTEFDLALSANANGELHELRAPVLLMPHGAGHNRLLRTSEGFSTEVSGLARSQLVRDGKVVPAAIALSHQEQVARLERYCPEALPFAVVTGDPCFDRLLAHLPRRQRYRRALGVPEGGRLVLVSSTWGEHSLFGDSSLISRLVSDLPLDEYRVVVAAHPNVWKGYGGLQVRLWLAEARAAGLMLVPPERGWQAALIAADVVVGDHGSVTFYGAALDRPTLLASSGGEFAELDPRSPTAELCRLLPRVDRLRPLREQVEEVVAAHRPGAYAGVTGRTLGEVGRSGELLRRTAYRLMDLACPPGRAVPAALPEPDGERTEVTAFLVQTEVEPGARRVVVRRFPATAKIPAEAHLVVDVEELDRRLLESAAVIIHYGEQDDILKRYPGCAAAALIIGSQARVALRDGREVLLTASGGGVDPACLPSVVYGWLALGHPLEQLIADDVVVRAGAGETRIRVTPPPID